VRAILQRAAARRTGRPIGADPAGAARGPTDPPAAVLQRSKSGFPGVLQRSKPRLVSAR
jgi:hypothetical protein